MQQALNIAPQRETPGEQAGRFKDHHQPILTQGREPKTKTECDMKKSSTTSSLAPVAQSRNTPELTDLFGELEVVSSSEPPQDDAAASPAQGDLFEVVVLVHDWPVKDDVSSMEYPIFSLSKNKDTRIRTYSRGGKTLKVIPSALGAATVFDKDILLYCLSQIVKAHDAGMTVGRRLKIAVHPFLVGTRRSTGGAAYVRVVDMCRRLKGTTIETNVKTNEREQTEGFGLIEDYKVTQYTKNGKGALELELTIADWLYRAAIASDILTLHPDYFSLGQALERRLYELGRKHCGQQPWFTIGLPLLQEKAGSTQTASNFRTELKEIIKLNRLPDYRLALDESCKPNQVVFMTRDTKRLVAEANRAGRMSWMANMLQQSMELTTGKPKAAA